MLSEYNHEINVFDMLLFSKCVILNAYDIPRRQRETIPSEMVTLLQTQLTDATAKMAGLVNTKTEAVQKALDRINNVALPDQRRHIDEALKAAADGVEAARRELELQCKTQIDIFGERIEAFEIGVSATQMKFRRLASDMDLFRKSLQDSTAKVEDMTKIMRAEQQAQTKIISTLVELEFIQ